MIKEHVIGKKTMNETRGTPALPPNRSRRLKEKQKTNPQEENSAAFDYSLCKSVAPGTDDAWCSQTCATGTCPKHLCQCGQAEQEPVFVCKSKRSDATDLWCAETCKSGTCPPGATDLCKCEAGGSAASSY